MVTQSVEKPRVFFGILGLPGGYEAPGGAFTEARIRLAITATLMEYLVYFGTLVFLPRDQNVVGYDKDVLPTLTDLIKIAIPFYFGASAAVQIAAVRSKGTQRETTASSG
jgi:hypothetical protein